MPVLDPHALERAPPAAFVEAAAPSPSSPATAGNPMHQQPQPQEPQQPQQQRATTSAGETVETIACGHATALPDGSRIALCRVRPSKRYYVPPMQFGLVCDGLVRCGQPTELNFPFLEKLDLKTVVWLAPEVPSDPLWVHNSLSEVTPALLRC